MLVWVELEFRVRRRKFFEINERRDASRSRTSSSSRHNKPIFIAMSTIMRSSSEKMRPEFLHLNLVPRTGVVISQHRPTPPLLLLLLLSSVPPIFVSAETLARLNWLTADLQNAAFTEFAAKRYGDAQGQEWFLSSSEFGSSSAALQGLVDGSADVVLECWNSTDNACDRTTDTTSFSSGMLGETTVYAPTYFVREYPHLSDWSGFRAREKVPENLRVLGSVASWPDAALFRRALAEESGLAYLVGRLRICNRMRNGTRTRFSPRMRRCAD